jgi:hypothetical protein
MPANHVLLETIALTKTAASVTFDNIPQTGYTDLKIVASTRCSRAAVDVEAYIKFNGNSSNYSYRLLFGTGASTGSQTNTTFPPFITNCASSTANTFSSTTIDIPNYTQSTNKLMSMETLAESATATVNSFLVAGSWANSSAITSIELYPFSDSWVAGSTFSLYGVANVNTTPTIAPLATGGNIIANDGTYWYHAFLSSGTFTPYTALTCDYLVVGGGGAGAPSRGGGAGAGGLRSTVGTTGGTGSLESPLEFSASSHPVLIGAGGAPTSGAFVFPGSNSTLYSPGNTIITSLGGGGGGNSGAGGSVLGAGQAGGSGGGGHFAQKPGGAGTSGQGFNGGTADNTRIGGAGGGGAGAVGANSPTANNDGGAGGIGRLQTAFSSATGTGVSGYFAGGGGGGYFSDGGTTGGAGGLGGGGTGGVGGAAQAGVANTGGGGAAGRGNPGGIGDTVGASGGSGIVIIRYPMV